MKVFVYGTLMKGEGNHSLLDNKFSEYIGPAITKRGYTLYNLGSFPGVIEKGTSAVLGEVYEVCAFTLSRLDYLEGHPHFYKRKKVVLRDGSTVQMYFLKEEDVVGCPVIKSGDWKNK
jgi:gamma-glutamylaminecyclotransferase